MEEGLLKPEFISFTNGIVTELQTKNEENANDVIAASFTPILETIQKEAAQRNLLLFRQYWFTILTLFSSIEPLAKLVIRHGTPKTNDGRTYENTLLGAILTLSCLPKTADEPFYFFEKPLEQASNLLK